MDLAAPADQARLPRTKCRFETKNSASCSPPMHLTRAQLTARSRDCRVMLETPRVQILVASYSIDFPGKPSSHRLRGWAGCRKDCEFRRDPFFSYQASASRCRPFSSTCHTVPLITSSAVSHNSAPIAAPTAPPTMVPAPPTRSVLYEPNDQPDDNANHDQRFH
jgi:hypothetical protein